MEKQKQLPLHDLHVDNFASTFNRIHALSHSLFISIHFYYRFYFLYLILTQNDDVFTKTPILPCLLLLLAELLLFFIWLSSQAYRVRLVDRTTFTERLPQESELPPLDVLICTADPNKEPTLEVMNTVVSAMALDYAPNRLHVYLSDDGGSTLTLKAVKEAWGFATWWVPFCRKYEVKCRCPMAYFAQEKNQEEGSHEFITQKMLLKEKYVVFKQRMTKLGQNTGEVDNNYSKSNHPSHVQIINEDCVDPSIVNPDCDNMPMLVYVAREKRPSQPHHFKAGALNALLRVSALLSNSPIVLVLDCDMYCNDPTSAKQAMCFFLDPHISPSLAFAQFPQRFHNVAQSHDLYDTAFRWAHKVLMPGMDGLGAGPPLIGTGFYMKRKAIFSSDLDMVELRNNLGPSNQLIKILSHDDIKAGEICKENLHEAEFVASCSYENGTKWGDGEGFYYYSVAEDAFTGYRLHCKGWKSVYINPERAAFLGSSTTNLNDVLTQIARWTVGLCGIGISKFSPLFYGPSRKQLSLLDRFSNVWFHLYGMAFASYWCFAIIPQLCLLHGVPVYSKVPSLSFTILAYILLASLLKNLHEGITTGGTLLSWWNAERMWLLKMLTCHTYGSIDAIMKIIGLKNSSFIPTNKFIDDEQDKRYRQGIFDFQTSDAFLVPIGMAVILNLVCLAGGLARVVRFGNWDEMAAQIILSGLLLMLSKPIIEGMIARKDKGRFPVSATLKSIAACMVILVLGPFFLFH